MATNQEMNEILIKRMNRICRPRWNPEKDQKRYLETVQVYCRVLGGYSPQVLSAGMDLWEAGWTKSSWPLPAELASYMNQAREDLKPPVQVIEDRSEEPRERTPNEVAAYRAETARIVARLKDRLAWLDKHPATQGTFARKIEPQNLPMPKEFIERLGVDLGENSDG